MAFASGTTIRSFAPSIRRHGKNFKCSVALTTRAALSDSVPLASELRNNDPEATAVVVGASRGIGLAISQALLKRFKGRIIACCRNPGEAGALGALWQFAPERFSLVPVDVTKEETLKAAAQQIKDINGGRLDLVINTAGFLHDRASGRMPEKRLSAIDSDFFLENMKINALGPVLLSKHLAPLMAPASKDGTRSFPIFSSISARVGSIEDNQIGGWYSYRAAKAAQNQFLRTLSREKRWLCCVALHPGTVATDLSEPFQANVKPEKLFPVDLAAAQLLDVLDSLSLSEDSGKFFAYDRSEIPW